MLTFLEDPGFLKEYQKLNKRYKNLDKAVEILKKLLLVQFHLEHPKIIIAPGKLHRVTQHTENLWTLWKVELQIPNSGLRPNQCPRVWFVVSGEQLIFLSMASHVDNFDTNQVDHKALERLQNYF